MKNTARLDSRSLLKLSGEEAHAFLQNLITCNVDNLKPGGAAFGALLTPQGKVLFDFFLQSTDDGFLLDVEAKRTAELTKRLNFYKLRADVAIKPVDLPVFALWGDGKTNKNETGFVDPRFARLGMRYYGADLQTNATEDDWQNMRIQTGMPQSGADFELGTVFPHEVLMDQFGGVDFSKGCYVGQEVVSRMQHRGTARNRMVKVKTENPHGLPERDTDIISGDRKLGRLGSSNGKDGIALVRLDRLAGAREAGQAVTAGEAQLQFERPEFVHFEWSDGAN